jgi:hypothetical protein
MAEVQQQPGAPSVIRIKRKRDDAPLDSLYLEGSKRRATDHTYIFKRLDQERRIEPIFRQEYFADGIPKIRTTTEGEETRDPYALGRVRDVPTPTKQKKAEDVSSAGPRRFHLSRAMSVSAAAKGKTEVATFVERRGLAQSVGTAGGLQGTGEDKDTAEEQQKPLKRPTARARKAQTSDAGTATPPVVPAPAKVDVSLAQKMDQWSQQTSQQEALAAERGVNIGGSGKTDAMEIDNEADYVYDTYYRHEAVTSGNLPSTGISFGHLVIDEDQEDLWETYLDGEDSDEKEFETDEEDSNGEYYVFGLLLVQVRFILILHIYSRRLLRCRLSRG